jgi:type II secretory pathway component HofQ
MWITFNFGSLYWKGAITQNNSGNYISIWEISEDVLKMEENSTKMDLDQIKYWLIQDRFGEMFQLHNL